MDIKLKHVAQDTEIVWGGFYAHLLTAGLHNGHDSPWMALGSVNRIGYLYGVAHNKPFWLHHVVAELEDGRYIAIGTVHVLTNGTHLMSVYVHPSYRRRGLGARLIRTLLMLYPQAHGVSTAQSARLYDTHSVPLLSGDDYLPAMLTKSERRAIREQYQREFEHIRATQFA